jgi:hypothetical protein
LNTTQFIAALLYVASGDIPMPNYWRYVRARRDLCKVLRGAAK